MQKTTPHLLNRTEHFQGALIGEGLIIGAVSGMVVLLYRVALKYADTFLQAILQYMQKSPLTTGLWFVILAGAAFVVSKLVQWEPMASGSGIPQLEGEMTGKLDACWWRVLLVKFTGGFLSLLCGLSLGREGPSIQLGAMAGKGFSRLTKRGITEEKFLLTCGASAGLSAAFHAPLAGIMFSLEEIHKSFSAAVIVSVMTASLTADYLSSNILGFEPVFQFDIGFELKPELYWSLLLLGALLGVLGAFYNKAMLKIQSLMQTCRYLNPLTRMMVPFLLAGVLGFTVPELLGSGNNMVTSITSGEWTLGVLLLLFVGKFLFSAVSFGSGAPGGIFFPLLVLGSLIGGAFGTAGVEFFGLDPSDVNNFVLLSMAGYFTAIVRAPLTGIILIFEMTGSVSQMLSLSIVSIVAYIVANWLRSDPIYESLLDAILKRQGNTIPENQEKVLLEFVIRHGSEASGKKVKDLKLPGNCLLVSIQRGRREMIPRGNTVLLPGDTLAVMTAASDEGGIYDAMRRICT